MAVVVAVASALVLGDHAAGALGAANLAPAVEHPLGGHTSRRWHWPLAPPWRVTKPYVAPATPYSAGHRGIDLASRPGDPVFAVADGVVAFAGRVVDRPVLSIGHPGSLVSSMEPVIASIAVGREVRAGQRVGTVGSGGHCRRRCVHLGVRLDGGYVSPLRFLASVPRAVLLPLE